MKIIAGSVLMAAFSAMYVTIRAAVRTAELVATQTVVDPSTLVGGAMLVNLGVLAAGLFVIFKAGRVFQGWLDAVKGAQEYAAQLASVIERQSVHSERFARVEERLIAAEERVEKMRLMLDTLEERYGIRRELGRGDKGG